MYEPRKAHVLYHADCMDGFTAAWAASQRLGDRATYTPASYGDPPPEMDPEREVFILDFSYPKDTMLELHEKHDGRVTLLDHHKTAQEELGSSVPGCHFDMEHSGARMAWDFWNKRVDPRYMPAIIQYVEDRDLWRWELWESRAINAALASYPKEFTVWDKLSRKPLLLKDEGHAILRREEAIIAKLLQQTVWRSVLGHRVPTVNTPVMVSEACEALLEAHPEALFAAAYSDMPDPDYELKQRWSLRSRPGFDVSEIAKQLGGGGHPQAAGYVRKGT